MGIAFDSGDVAIIGGGIIGLSTAFELAARGAQVRVFDVGEPAAAASWAAAGMLAPRTEQLHDDALRALCEQSLSEYPAFVQRVRDASGIDPHLRLDGILHAAFSRDAGAQHEQWVSGLAAAGCAAQQLTRQQTLEFEPALAREVTGAVLVEGEGQIDNRRLGRALVQACRNCGVRIHPGVRYLTVESDARRVLGIRTDIGYVAAGAVINAAGAWAARVPGVPSHAVPPVFPVKGEMLALDVPLGLLRRTTWVPGAYLVPRADGRLLVGATAKKTGFDARVTAGGIAGLLESAIRAVPPLAGFTVSETWAGLRPATPDERPFLGGTPLGGYFLACGHYRNGILLAPATADMLADVLQGRNSVPAAFSFEPAGTKNASPQRRQSA